MSPCPGGGQITTSFVSWYSHWLRKVLSILYHPRLSLCVLTKNPVINKQKMLRADIGLAKKSYSRLSRKTISDTRDAFRNLKVMAGDARAGESARYNTLPDAIDLNTFYTRFDIINFTSGCTRLLATTPRTREWSSSPKTTWHASSREPA